MSNTVTVSFRWPPALRKALEDLARDNHRDLTNQVLIAIEEHLAEHGRWPMPKATTRARRRA